MATCNLQRKPLRLRATIECGFDAAGFIAAHQAVGNRVTIEVGLGGRPVVSVGAVDGLNPISLRLERKFSRQRRADPGFVDKVRQALATEANHV